MEKHTHAQFELPHIPSMRAQGLDKGVLMAMYLFGSTGLRDFLQPIGASGFKAGLSGRKLIEGRLCDVRLRGYASIVAPLHDRASAIQIHPLAKEWFLTRLPDPNGDPEAMRLMGQLTDAKYHEGVIQFRLPQGLRISEVEKRFQALLAPRNLNTFLASKTGQKRLEKVGLDPTARLFTDYTDMGCRNPRRSLVCEIFLVRPQRELAVLLKALVVAIESEQEAALNRDSKK